MGFLQEERSRFVGMGHGGWIAQDGELDQSSLRGQGSKLSRQDGSGGGGDEQRQQRRAHSTAVHRSSAHPLTLCTITSLAPVWERICALIWSRSLEASSPLQA